MHQAEIVLNKISIKVLHIGHAKKGTVIWNSRTLLDKMTSFHFFVSSMSERTAFSGKMLYFKFKSNTAYTTKAYQQLNKIELLNL